MLQMTLAEVHLKWSAILMDLLALHAPPLQNIFMFYFQGKYNIYNITLYKVSYKQIVQFQFLQNYVAISTA